MKKAVSILLICAILLSAFSLVSSAGETENSRWNGSLKKTASAKNVIPASGSCGTGVIFTYNNTTKVLRIKSTNPDYYYYTQHYASFEKSPFCHSNVKEVIFDDCFRNIGSYMFIGCEALQKVTLPANLEKIGEAAFQGCYALRNIEFPEGLKTIGKWAFSGAMLEEIHLPQSVREIGAFAFYGAAVAELELNCPITSIPAFAFGGCNLLTKLVIPDTVTNIANYAFSECRNLKDLTIPCSAKIDYFSFNECKSLETITLSKGMGRMQDFTRFIDKEKMHYIYTPQYNSCEQLKLKHVVIEDGVDYIGDYSFSNLLISKVSFKGTVRQFGSRCFSNYNHCEGNLVFGACNDNTDILYNLMNTDTLEEVVLTENVGSVWHAPIEECPHLERVVVLSRQTDIDRLLPKIHADIPLYLFSGSKAQRQADEKGVPYTLIDENCAKTGNHLVSLEPEYLQAPDCTDGGVAVYRCLACGAECAREEVGALSHDYRFVGTTEPGCTRTGERKYICARCGDVFAEEIPATGHVMRRWIVNEVEPTCQKEGLCYWYCHGECAQYYEIRPVAKTGHRYVEKVVEPTCLSEGYTVHTCAFCGDSYKDEYKPPVEHQPSQTLIRNRTAATCDAQGGYDEVVYCKVCQRELSKQHYTLPSVEHHYTDSILKAEVNKNGSILKLCMTCGKLAAKSTIYRPSTYQLSQTKFVYNALSKKPALTVKDSAGKRLEEGTDYQLTRPSKAKDVGSYSLRVTFTGNYSGSKKINYVIVPKAVYITSLKAEGNNVRVRWKKQKSQTDGYQIRYSTSPSFSHYKTITVRSNFINAKTISALKHNTNYYWSVRTFKTVNHVNYFSSWSKVEKVKTK